MTMAQQWPRGTAVERAEVGTCTGGGRRWWLVSRRICKHKSPLHVQTQGTRHQAQENISGQAARRQGNELTQVTAAEAMVAMVGWGVAMAAGWAVVWVVA